MILSVQQKSKGMCLRDPDGLNLDIRTINECTDRPRATCYEPQNAAYQADTMLDPRAPKRRRGIQKLAVVLLATAILAQHAAPALSQVAFNPKGQHGYRLALGTCEHGMDKG